MLFARAFFCAARNRIKLENYASGTVYESENIKITLQERNGFCLHYISFNAFLLGSGALKNICRASEEKEFLLKEEISRGSQGELRAFCNFS